MELDNNTKQISSKTVNLNENTNQLNKELIKQEAPDADDVQFEVCTVKSETLSTDDKFESPSPDTCDTEVINNLSLVLKSETLDQDSSKVKSEESIFIKEELLHKQGDIKTEERTVQESRVEDEHNLGNQIPIHLLPNVVKRFKCNICDRWFVLKTSLESHLKFHTKPFKCHLCDYSCAHHGSLMTHLRTHSGGKPFKCNICDYTAAQISCLRHHLTTHCGKKPFNCYICCYSCEHKCQLQHHIRTHTRQERYKSKFVIVSVQRKVAERAIKH